MIKRRDGRTPQGGGERRGSGSLAPSAVRPPAGGVPPALLAAVRPPGLHFSFGVKKSTGRLGSVGGGALLQSPHPTQANTPAPTPRSQSPSKRVSRLFPRDVDESGARVLRLWGCRGQGEGGETVGRGKAGLVLPRALDRLSAPTPLPRAEESGAVTGDERTMQGRRGRGGLEEVWGC